MKTICMTYKGGNRTIEVGCNSNGEGLFTREPNGSWRQHAGNGQCHSRTPAELAKRFRAWSDSWTDAKMIPGSADGWTVRQ